MTDIPGAVFDAYKDHGDAERFLGDLPHRLDGTFVTEAELAELLGRGIHLILDDNLNDDRLSVEEEELLAEWTSVLSASFPHLRQHSATERAVKASLLRNLQEGTPLTSRMDAQGLPFLFQKSEELIWTFSPVQFYQNTTRTEYVGGSHGVSIRLTKGVYYRTGSFKGRPVKVDELSLQGTGMLAITTKHLYFWSPNTAFKVPFSKLISLETFEDGIRIQRDGTTTKPQTFSGLDGWFAANLISNLQAAD